MRRNALFNIAASSLIIGTTMVGCSGAAMMSRAGASAGKLQALAAAQARYAEKAIAARDGTRAVTIAEAAVAANPNDAAYRTLLGRAYLVDGRFSSARTAFQDALTLGAKDPRTIVNLSLIHVAEGRADSARSLLADHMDVLPAADYGLAMAMAGDPAEAIRVLSQAIHDPNAGVKERQNLAYSLALAGQWTEARQIASFDMAPMEAAKRVIGWAKYAQAGQESQRVVAMLGVSPRGDDTGLPVRLALQQDPQAKPDRQAMVETPADPAPIETPAEPVALAQADVVPAPFAAPPVSAQPTPASVEIAFASPMPAPGPIVQAAFETKAPLRAVNAEEASAKAPTFVPVSWRKASSAKASVPSARPESRWQPVDAAKGSAWVVQLGAFSSEESASNAWKRYQHSNASLSAFPQVYSTIALGGQNYHRLALAGFGGRSDADQFCALLRSKGTPCFVRLGGAEAAPARWAMTHRKPQQLAMR
jgi:Flp pilus assembly protein TadD